MRFIMLLDAAGMLRRGVLIMPPTGDKCMQVISVRGDISHAVPCPRRCREEVRASSITFDSQWIGGSFGGSSHPQLPHSGYCEPICSQHDIDAAIYDICLLRRLMHLHTARRTATCWDGVPGSYSTGAWIHTAQCISVKLCSAKLCTRLQS